MLGDVGSSIIHLQQGAGRRQVGPRATGEAMGSVFVFIVIVVILLIRLP